MPTLNRLTDGRWSFTLFPSREENITVAMAVDGVALAPRSLLIAGRSPFGVDPARSLAAATLLSQVTWWRCCLLHACTSFNCFSTEAQL